MNRDSDLQGARADTPVRRAKPPVWPLRVGAHPMVLVGLYSALGLAPVALVLVEYPLHRRPLVDELASVIGLTAFAIMLLEFVLSGRHRWVSGRIGIDRTMRVHRIVAYAMVGLIVVHPFVYAAPADASWPWFVAADPRLDLGAWSIAAGVAAWIGVAALVMTAADRSRLPCRYETWRGLHAAGAFAVAALVAVHAFTAGGYSSRASMVALWATLLGAAVLTLAHVHLLRPWRQRRNPYVIQTIDRVGARTWALRLVPGAGHGDYSAHRFRPGQFAWLKLGGRAYLAREHPFSMSSPPEEAPELGFTIKEKGDFTDHIGELAAGTTAYVDGPHGHLVPDEDEVPTVYIAGGTGIGPVLSHLRAFHAEGDQRPLVLVYGSHTAEQIAERDELESLARVLDLTLHLVVRQPGPGWEGAIGPLDRALLERCLPPTHRAAWRYFVCGPVPMVAAVRRDLRALGVPARRIVSGS